MPAPLPRTAVLIVNAKSRKGRDLFEQARGTLMAAGIELSGAHALRDPSRLEGTVQAAVAGGAPMVIIGGGDGSLSASSTIWSAVTSCSPFCLSARRTPSPGPWASRSISRGR